MNDAIDISSKAARVLARAALPWLLALLVATAVLLLVGASQAMAATVVAGSGEGAGQVSDPNGLAADFETGRFYVADQENHRIDVFDSAGHFVMAFGWGVADGKAEPETCGPAASPPTASCRQGLEGGGGGELGRPLDVAVDNSPSSASRHDVYVIDQAPNIGELIGSGVRVEKFSPSGQFLLAWGGGVISAGAEGTGDLTAGSSTVADVKTTSRAFELGQTILSPGKIAAETKIVGIGAGTITLSSPALASGAAVGLEVEAGPGQVPVNEVDELVESSEQQQGVGLISNGFSLAVTTEDPSHLKSSTETIGTGRLAPSSSTVTELSEEINGSFLTGEILNCCGGSPTGKDLKGGSAIAELDPAAHTLTLSKPTEPGVESGLITLTTTLPFDASATLIEAALAKIPSIGPGNIGVSGPPGGPYRFEFKGSRFADTNMAPLYSTSISELYTTRNGRSAAEICTAATAASCAAGVQGGGPGQFDDERSAHIAVGPDGSVYVSDGVDEPIGNQSAHPRDRLQKFEPDGSFVDEITLPNELIEGLAIDSSGDLYVAGGAGLRKYDSAGTLLETLTTKAMEAVSVDDADHVFALESFNVEGATPQERKGGWAVVEFDPSGAVLHRFGYGEVSSGPGLAPYAGGLYVSNGYIGGSEGDAALSRVLLNLSFPPSGPLLFPEACIPSFVGSGRATLHAYLNSEGEETTTHFEYITEADFLANGESFVGAHPATSTSEASAGSDFLLHEVQGAATPLVPETAYRCRVLAKNTDGEPIGQEGKFETKEPFEFGPIFVSSVGSESAVLHAEGNPLGIPTEAHFEYVDDADYRASGFAKAKLAPKAPLDFGAGEETVAKEAKIEGLDPGTGYHFRLRVENASFSSGITCPHGGASCPDHEPLFQTLAASTPGLPDGRAYELVSPSDKNSAEVAVPRPAGGAVDLNEIVPRMEAASESSQDPAVTYTSWTSFGETSGAPGTSQYLSKRTEQGWVTENISPAGRQLLPLNPPLRGFSPDLRFAALVNREPRLTTDAQPGLENMYIRDNDSGELTALTKEPISFTPVSSDALFRRFCTTFAGTSTDGRHAFFSADGAMAGAPSGVGFSLYESSQDGAPLKLVSVLPDGTPASPAKNTHFGGEELQSECTVDQGPIRHAVSADGSVVFWTYGGTYKESPEPLLARIDGTRTVQLDAKVAGEKNGGKGQFWAATADGSEAFFTAPDRLTSVAHAAGQLYAYNTAEGTTTDLTPGSTAPEIEGVIGAADDGSAVYFVGKGALTAGQENGGGETAVAGADNLYSWHQGEGLHFIAILSGLDQSDWGVPSALTARLTPDGEHLAFLSTETEALSGYDNLKYPAGGCQAEYGSDLLHGDPHCQEVYLYDAESHDLTCVSCNPSAARPAGPAGLPPWTNPLEGPRYLSADGARLFFESPDSLSSDDTDETRDVYEFERPGSGTCTAQAPTFVESDGGCLSLISNGKSDDDSYFIDASADGRDVFFATRSSLVSRDRNANFDVYDASEGGGFPEPPPASPPCEGEACKPPSVAQPDVFGSPSSLTFNGSGNVTPTPALVPKPKAKPLTRAQKLSKALSACKKTKGKVKKAACLKRAEKLYAPVKKAKGHRRSPARERRAGR
jgi:NHL repeat